MTLQQNLNYINANNGQGKIGIYNTNTELDIIEFAKNHKKEIDNELLKTGGIILRGFSIRSVSEFNKLASIISPYLLDYVNRSTPRTNIGGKIYTATEYPADRSIPLHNENAYTLAWPNKILFFSVIVAQSGGETPVADSRRILAKLDKAIVNKFKEKQVLYVRNYTPGIDLSWQEVFQTSNKHEVENYCNENKIEYTWLDSGGVELITKQKCQATITHPTTHEEVWFNQAHLFHISSLNEADRNTLTASLGKGAYPRNSYYGDGTEFDEKDLNHIREIYDSEKIVFKWKKGDVMILDNILMAHSRTPFTGERKVVVAMGN